MGAFLALIALPVMFVAGLVLTTTGLLDWHHQRHAYDVAFLRPGDECGSEVADLDARTGEPLDCTAFGLPGGRIDPDGTTGTPAAPEVDIPGFTAAQNAGVGDLAAQLARDGGLSPADRDRIQARVDLIAATVPPQRRPYLTRSLHGPEHTAVGAALLAVPLVLLAVFRRAR